MGVNSTQCRLSSIIVSGERREVGVAILLSAKKKNIRQSPNRKPAGQGLQHGRQKAANTSRKTNQLREREM